MQVLPPATTPQGSATDQWSQPLGVEERYHATDGTDSRTAPGSWTSACSRKSFHYQPNSYTLHTHVHTSIHLHCVQFMHVLVDFNSTYTYVHTVINIIIQLVVLFTMLSRNLQAFHLFCINIYIFIYFA